MPKFIKKLSPNKSKSKAKPSAAPSSEPTTPAQPQIARRSMNRKSTIKSGRTIGEKREHLETANERAAARKKDKRKNTWRVIFVSIGFMVFATILIAVGISIISSSKDKEDTVVQDSQPTAPIHEPTVEIVDEDASATNGKITNRMREYIGQAEADFRDLGYAPIKAVLPTGTIREVNFYLEGHPGFVKMTIDRDTAVSVEDADRMFRYLEAKGITDFSYIDVRLDGKAYWK
ncbi:hypothetical protein IJF93_01240 [Candidatus Saccharibacteria bacterium]|nr:hypothetical protein [Candidatus Saccharibacteria bacterium]